MDDLFKNCPFKIEVHQKCEGTREFNALDDMFYVSDPLYLQLCKLCGLSEVVSPSKLMVELEKIRGVETEFEFDNKIYTGKLDFDERWNIVLKDCILVENLAS